MRPTDSNWKRAPLRPYATPTSSLFMNPGNLPPALFIAMEWIDGSTFRAILDAGQTEVSQAMDWGGQAARALSAAHTAGILHCDMKPENIMLRKDGVVKILDFGLARHGPAVGSDPNSMGASGTISGTLSGTLLYMPPEILRGETVTSASDVFSPGVFLYELTAGQHPFAGETPLDVFEEIECRTVAGIECFREGVPVELDRLILKMLSTGDRATGRQRRRCASACEEVSWPINSLTGCLFRQPVNYPYRALPTCSVI
jgi:serine/threonine protein kinase